MLLTVDIGNTNVTLGAFDNNKLTVTWRMETNTRRMADEYAATLLDLINHEGLKTSDFKEVSLLSVVPGLQPIFEDLFKRYFKINPLIIGPGVKTKVRIRFDNPKEVGADRIAHTAAAYNLYGGPVIVVDMGTATVFDTVSKEGDFLGGAVAPGIIIAAEALFTRTAQLYRVPIQAPKHAIGSSTTEAMQSGIVYGYVGLVESIVTRIQNELGGKVKVVATGGNSGLIAGQTKIIDVVNPDLVLYGLKLIYEMNRT